jgi:undecaprenyl-diphosphatase
MSKLIVFLLGFVQGVAEFLPISSSGHLNLIQHFLRYKNSLVLDIFLNTASLLSVLVFFRKQIVSIIKKTSYLLVSVLPVALFVFLIDDKLDSLFETPIIISIGFLISSIFLFSTKFIKSSSKNLNFKIAFLIGLLQIVAILPGVSRSATTIFTALLLGLSAKDAFEYSFYLYIPSSLGALILSTSRGISVSYFVDFWPALLICFILGLLSLRVLKKITINNNLWYFSFYTLFMSILSFFLLF